MILRGYKHYKHYRWEFWTLVVYGKIHKYVPILSQPVKIISTYYSYLPLFSDLNLLQTKYNEEINSGKAAAAP